MRVTVECDGGTKLGKEALQDVHVRVDTAVGSYLLTATVNGTLTIIPVGLNGAQGPAVYGLLVDHGDGGVYVVWGTGR